MADHGTMSIHDIFKDLMILVEAHEIMTSDLRLDGIKRARSLQDNAINRVARATPLRETRTVGDIFVSRAK